MDHDFGLVQPSRNSLEGTERSFMFPMGTVLTDTFLTGHVTGAQA